METLKEGWGERLLGSEGHLLASGSTRLPADAKVAPRDHLTTVWASPTSDRRAVPVPEDRERRLAACWYSPPGRDHFEIELTLDGSRTRRISVYCLDWERAGRQQRLELRSAADGSLLDAREIREGMGEGVLLAWEVRGDLRLRVSRLAGPNAVVSAFSFDAAGRGPGDLQGPRRPSDPQAPGQAPPAAPLATQERTEQALGRWIELHQRLEPLAKANRLKQAEELVDQLQADGSWAAAKDWLRQEREDLGSLRALRGETLQALTKRKGEPITLRGGGTPIKGKIAGSDGRGGIQITLPGGAMATVTEEQLGLEDLLRLALPALGSSAADSLQHRRLGYLHLLSGDLAKAKESFDRVAQIQPAQDLTPYLRRLEALRRGRLEDQAKAAWDAAEGLLAQGDLNGARKAYEAFKADFEHTEFLAGKRELWRERLERLTLLLSPTLPGLLGRYCAGDRFEESGILLTRADEKIDFNWGEGRPDPAVPQDDFMARWDGILKVEEPGKYTFTTQCDDGARLWIDERPVITTGWRIQHDGRHSGQIPLGKGLHRLRLEYFEHKGYASIRITWALENQFAETLVPKEVLSHIPPAVKKPGP